MTIRCNLYQPKSCSSFIVPLSPPSQFHPSIQRLRLHPHFRILPRNHLTMAAPLASASQNNAAIANSLSVLRRILPPLSVARHKGQNGRITIIGGSRDYTGAPFYAAMSSLRAGCDLATILALSEAVTPIKAYSPDIVVSPLQDDLLHLDNPFNRAHACVVGPGLGRSERAIDVAIWAAESWNVCDTENKGKCLLLDADALWMLSQQNLMDRFLLQLRLHCKRSSHPVILTPNAMELKRICSALHISCENSKAACTQLARWFQGGAIIVGKGVSDTIVWSKGSDEGETRIVSVDLASSRKRVGGQGDILAGIAAAFVTWATLASTKYGDGGVSDGTFENRIFEHFTDVFDAVVAAAVVTREATRRGFAAHGRALVASDVLHFIGGVVSDVENKNLTFPMVETL